MNCPSCVAGKTSKREWDSSMIFFLKCSQSPCKNTLETGTPVLWVWFLCFLLRLWEIWTWWENSFLACVCLWMRGVVDSLWLRDLWRSTSVSHMNHLQLGSLILPFASSAKTSIVECGVVVGCGSSHPLWKSTRSFTSTNTTFYNFPSIHKRRNGCSPVAALLFCSQPALCFLLSYISNPYAEWKVE